MENDATKRFAPAEGNMGLRNARPTQGTAATDFDLEGDGSLHDFNDIVTLSSATRRGIVNEFAFTPIFSDLDDDGYLDLVIATDFDPPK